jgi:catechol 2,3-dioxygenase
VLGAPGGRPLVELHEQPGVRPVPRRGLLGLFHFAILLPDRASLGRFVSHLGQHDVAVGSADHLVSEALYLNDPDGLGIEVYRDRPRAEWSARDRQLAMATDPLDVRGVLAAGEGVLWTGVPAETTMGHVHLSVGDIARGKVFYHDALGLDMMVWDYPGALFLAAGGYHHHLGTNTWAQGAPAATDQDARLLDWELVLPAASDVEAASASIRGKGFTVADGVTADPWGTQLRLVTEHAVGL